MSQRSLPCKLYDADWSRLALAGVTLLFFFLSANFCAETVCMQNQAAGCGGGRNMCLLCQLWAKEFEDQPSTSLHTKHHDPEVDQSNCTSPGPTEFAHFKISGNVMPIGIFRHMDPSSCVRTKPTRPMHSAHEDPNGDSEKQIGLRRSPAPTLECMQMNRCQGRKASPSVASNWLFPMVTVTNDSQNHSTLNSCNFAVP